MKYPHAGGFTLVETLFVVMILGILGAMGYGPIVDRVAASRVDSAARTVGADLRLAVSLASRQGAPVRIVFASEDLEYRILDRASGDVLFARGLGSGSDIPLSALTATPASVEVFPNRLTSAPIRIILEAGRHVSGVRMSSAGFVQVDL